VSRVVYFSFYQDVKQLRNFLYSQVGKEIVADRDIRPATRHGWELGSNAMAEIGEVSPTGVINEVYWTVYAKNEDERRPGVFVCSYPRKGRGCNRLFVQDKKSRNRLCPKCKTVNILLKFSL
jgi:predicted Zn-ribbon and HTH transcriptional regulator